MCSAWWVVAEQGTLGWVCVLVWVCRDGIAGGYMRCGDTRAMRRSSVRLRYIGDRIPLGWETERRVGETSEVFVRKRREEG